MENCKYEVANYKTKERVPVPKEQHIIVENTHEAIVSRKDYEQINAMISARHTPSVYTHENTFLGILKCSECGHILSLAHKPIKDGNTRGYTAVCTITGNQRSVPTPTLFILTIYTV